MLENHRQSTVTGQFGGGLVPAIVVTRDSRHPVTDSTPYSHYKLLRTIEQVWHLGYLGYAGDGANVSSMRHLLGHWRPKRRHRRPRLGSWPPV
jgi:hypothetical protein